MGGCCSRLFGRGPGGVGVKRSGVGESEMVQATANGDGTGGGSGGGLLAVDRNMSNPNIQFNGTEISGLGLALAGTSIEQDAAYWEYHVDIPSQVEGGELRAVGEDDDEDEFEGVKFGVCTRKDKKFYQTLEKADEDDDDSILDASTALMRSIPNLSHGDIVGVAVQQSDLPMIQFLLNGEPMHDLAINRFRGTVFPSVYLVEGVICRPAFDEASFKESPPHPRFGPLIAERGLI